MEPRETLPDLLGRRLDLVICGTAAGRHSASASAYYADSSNRLWWILHEVGLTPRKLVPEDFRVLLEFGIGLTDLAKHYSGPDSGLSDDDYDIAGFHEKIEEVQPRVLVFNGKKAASKYFLISTTKLDYGRQQEGIGATTLFVASSTSGRNRHWTRSPWYDCARLVQDLRRG